MPGHTAANPAQPDSPSTHSLFHAASPQRAQALAVDSIGRAVYFAQPTSGSRGRISIWTIDGAHTSMPYRDDSFDYMNVTSMVSSGARPVARSRSPDAIARP